MTAGRINPARLPSHRPASGRRPQPLKVAHRDTPPLPSPASRPLTKQAGETPRESSGTTSIDSLSMKWLTAA
jgi:hypothetical protein